MEIIDLILLGIILFGAFRGFKKGLLIEAFSLAVVIIGFWGAYRFSGAFGKYIEQYVNLPDERYVSYALFFVVLIGIIWVGILAAKALKASLSVSLIGSADRFMGAVLGFLKWLLGLSLFIWVLNFIDIKLPKEIVGKSLLYGPIQKIVPSLFEKSTDLLPKSEKVIEELKERMKNIEGR
ncbi:CvpA family protein [Aureibacter tunicatorum]|uniref:Membrane protein required for colicin V production n=1 Tax=Aureibacter tunicatorum TaxID=866807 RepID=A0AAE3XLD3_9BACT|nr:CvpA family protein [Aureibacter tunicatorum]MDR6238065.1 membrane protein required for colicin V production [Aureibacter tunicatorum]BDD03098.1 hypothetical protein AUTU_05810 [Aureibacter tunicatorum]